MCELYGNMHTLQSDQSLLNLAAAMDINPLCGTSANMQTLHLDDKVVCIRSLNMQF